MVLRALDSKGHQDRIAKLSYESYYAYEGDGSVELIAASREADAERTLQCTVNGRLLACKCFRSKCLSITIRGRNSVEPFKYRPVSSITKDSAGTAWDGDIDITESWRPKPYSPSKPKWPLSIEHITEFLAQHTLPSNRIPEGVIAISGSTSSGKSEVARGLIFKYLQRRINDAAGSDSGGRGRNPHLLTIEDPIEKFYFECKKDVESSRIVPPYVSQAKGLDYTPREVGHDTPSLDAALSDALRQTPAVVYIGEIRSKEGLQSAINFAGTGHLVVFTMHAGSLVETMDKLMQATEANSSMRRGQLADRLLAVINLWKVPELKPKSSGATYKLPAEFQVAVPVFWKKSAASIAGLVADGLSSLLPGSSEGADTVGRKAVLQAIIERATGDLVDLTEDQEKELSESLNYLKDIGVRRAQSADLEGL